MEYTRTRSQEFPVYNNWAAYNHNLSIVGGGAVPYSNVRTTQLISSGLNSLSSMKLMTMSDVVTPHFKRRIAEGEIINSPMTSGKTISTNSLSCFNVTKYETVEVGASHMTCPPWYIPGVFLQQGWAKTGTMPASQVFGTTCNHLNVPAIETTYHEEIAMTQARANVDLSKAQALMMIAEGGKTIASLQQIFIRAVRLFRIVYKLTRLRPISNRERKFLKDQFTAREIANRYMEVRYSLRPLLYDARQCVEALLPQKNFDRFTFRGYSSGENSTTSVGSRNSRSDNGLRVTPTTTTTRRVEVRAGVLTAIDVNTALNTWGFDQPIETLWELIPFSFVADWFFNIGSTIAALTPEVGVRELASWLVIKKSLVTKTSVHAVTPYTTGSTVSLDNCTMTKESWETERKVNIPKTIWPRFTLRLDGFKLLDLAIIIKNLAPKDGKGMKLPRKMY